MLAPIQGRLTQNNNIPSLDVHQDVLSLQVPMAYSPSVHTVPDDTDELVQNVRCAGGAERERV